MKAFGTTCHNKQNESASDLCTEETANSDLVTAIETTKTPRLRKIGLTKCSNEPAISRPKCNRSMDDFDYFDNLIGDLAEISRLLALNPSRFRYTHLSLIEEVIAFWDRLQGNNSTGRWANVKRTSPPKSGSSSNDSPVNTWYRSVNGSHSASPPNWRMTCGDIKASFGRRHFEPVFEEFPAHMHKVEKKVFIPGVPNYNFIGRILGPRGISARQIEADTNCKILIRGKGSVKDPEKEKRLVDHPGYEHLSEDLHVHISTEGLDLAECQRRMDRAMSIIEALLTPVYDEYKKTQLLQLAIINGTYRPLVKKKQKSGY